MSGGPSRHPKKTRESAPAGFSPGPFGDFRGWKTANFKLVLLGVGPKANNPGNLRTKTQVKARIG